MHRRTIMFVAICLFCLISSGGYIAGRSARMKADRVNCCIAIEGYPFWNATKAIAHGLRSLQCKSNRRTTLRYRGSTVASHSSWAVASHGTSFIALGSGSTNWSFANHKCQ